MINLKLRALEPDDLDIVYETENDESLWIYSNNSSPFSNVAPVLVGILSTGVP